MEFPFPEKSMNDLSMLQYPTNGLWSLATDGLCEEEVALVSARMKRKSYEAKSLIYSEGDPGSSVVIVESGRIRVFQANVDGEEYTLVIWPRGFCTGISSAIRNGARPVSVEAIEKTLVLELPRGDLLDLMRTIPQFAINISQILASIAEVGIRACGPLALSTAPSRLAKALLDLASLDQSAGETKGSVIRGLNHEYLASMIGATRSWVSIMLATFESNGAIHRKRNEINILNISILRAYVN